MRGYAAVGLTQPKSNYNIGSVLRAAECFGTAMVVASGKRYHHAPTDTRKAAKHLPLIQTDDLQSVVPFDCKVVCVELTDGAESLVDYKHPERAFYVFGPEDGTLGENTLSWCHDVVYIPSDRCLNLACTVNVVLYDRMAKQLRHQKEQQALNALRELTNKN